MLWSDHGRSLAVDDKYDDTCPGVDDETCVAEEDGSDLDLTFLGIFLCTLGSIALNCGNNIQSLGLQGEETLKKQMEDARKPVKPSPSLGRIFDAAEDALEGNGVQGNDAQDESEAENADEMRRHRKVFFVGTVIFVLGSVLTFVSFAFAPQSVLAPLESVQFVSNVVFTKFILKRKITKQQVIGTCLILLGCITSITFHVALGKKPDCDNDGDSSGDDHRRQLLAGDDVNQDDDDDSCEESHGPYPVPYLMHLYDNWVYQIFLGFVGGGAIILHITYYMYTKREKEGKPLPMSSTIRPLSYAMFSALFGTQSIVQAKCIASVLLLSFAGCSQWCFWFTYVMIVLWGTTVFVWLYRMGIALKLFDPTFMIPLLQVQFILFAIISGGIFFKEFNVFTWYQWIGFWGGIFIVCYGLYLLSSGVDTSTTEEADAKPVPSSGKSSKVVPSLDGPEQPVGMPVEASEQPSGDETPAMNPAELSVVPPNG